MNIRDCAKYLWPEGTYTFITAIYLFLLNKLNTKLLSIDFESPVKLLSFEGGTPIKYFVIALLLFGIGALLIWYRLDCIRYKTDSMSERLCAFVAILVLSVFLCLIFIFIDNPIFRAVLATVFMVVSIGYALTKS
ncbi:MAG TPA: hypothetical protein DIW17_09935 [Clostridiales bacterium]|jgi:hypothetical protein|uniref:hypothetical protein n=1 Tax=Muricomes intestini TaxID=1796634 RepID=UPI000E953A0C|nr:hypothetical protein [Lachnospiraceae bacterium]HCS74182.1 hypothetical protein [Clostridiales bacterium]